MRTPQDGDPGPKWETYPHGAEPNRLSVKDRKENIYLLHLAGVPLPIAQLLSFPNILAPN